MGAWEGTAPIIYAYRWRGCNAQGKACQDIPGATSPSVHVLVSADQGRTVRDRRDGAEHRGGFFVRSVPGSGAGGRGTGRADRSR